MLPEQVLFPEHHLSHAASAFYPSPFAEAAVLTVDGVGEWATTTYGYGKLWAEALGVPPGAFLAAGERLSR